MTDIPIRVVLDQNSQRVAADKLRALFIQQNAQQAAAARQQARLIVQIEQDKVREVIRTGAVQLQTNERLRQAEQRTAAARTKAFREAIKNERELEQAAAARVRREQAELRLQQQREAAEERAARRQRGITVSGVALGTVTGNLATRAIDSVTAGAKSALTTSINWEAEFNAVERFVGGSQAELAKLKKDLRDLSLDAKVGLSFEELAKIASTGGQLGVSITNMKEFVKQVAYAGQAGDATGEQVATALAKITSNMQLTESEFPKLSSALAQMGEQGASRITEITDTAIRLAAAARQVGISAADVLAFSNTVISLGQEPEAAGTAVSKVFDRISIAVHKGGVALQTYARVAGVSVADFKKAFQEDASKAILAFVTGLDRIPKKTGQVERAMELLDIKDRRYKQAVLNLAAGHEQLAKNLEDSRRAYEGHNVAEEKAAKAAETTARQIKIFQNRVADLANSLGELLLPKLNEFLKQAGEPAIETLKDLMTWFKNVKDEGVNLASILDRIATSITAMVQAAQAEMQEAARASSLSGKAADAANYVREAKFYIGKLRSGEMNEGDVPETLMNQIGKYAVLGPEYAIGGKNFTWDKREWYARQLEAGIPGAAAYTENAYKKMADDRAKARNEALYAPANGLGADYAYGRPIGPVRNVSPGNGRGGGGGGAPNLNGLSTDKERRASGAAAGKEAQEKERVARLNRELADLKAETAALNAERSARETEASFNEGLDALRNRDVPGGGDFTMGAGERPGDFRTRYEGIVRGRQTLLKIASGQILDAEKDAIEEKRKKDAARQKDDTAAIAQERAAKAEAEAKKATAEAEERRRKRDEEIDKAAEDATKRVAEAMSRRADEVDKQNADLRAMRQRFLDAEEAAIDARLADARERGDYAAETALLKQKAANARNRSGALAAAGILEGNGALFQEGLNGINQANRDLDAGMEDAFRRRAATFTGDISHWMTDDTKSDLYLRKLGLGPKKEDANAAAAAAAAAGVGGNLLNATLRGKGGQAFEALPKELGDLFAKTAADRLKAALESPLKKMFADIGKDLAGNLKGGGQAAAQAIGAAALALYDATAIFGAQGKKKQRGGILGGLLGAAAGSLIPGVGWLKGAGFGIAAGSQLLGFAEGGRYPVGRSVLVGEYGPELAVFDRPGRILSHEDSMRVASASGGSGGGGAGVFINGPLMHVENIHDAADARVMTHILTNQLAQAAAGSR